jgi:hypothetical protein
MPGGTWFGGNWWASNWWGANWWARGAQPETGGSGIDWEFFLSLDAAHRLDFIRTQRKRRDRDNLTAVALILAEEDDE